ncbi:ABC transporter ATP-binding protein [Acetivibrio clariflavus]|uniref:ABC-type antimicrobial peptide transport system, ATPase component n=1 Tax=Acetivibrio clariflavus (strain DSM 19732 / NBRC 101661 / EBR45) TaxID=720554 RepID=G8LZN2_ACECE|nr:ABC transporter ATP-binding protein [Acetivibrio clariflavus]AEV67933.1 ABC-type antimicrobial peptide transport system, ATPase component [Acetivibrio clariflavus DSM 19732]
MIELKNISKSYKGKGVFTRALVNVSLRVEPGDFIAIMGRSGSGKTTLLNILGCMDRFDEGEYLFDNVNIHKYREKELANFRNKNIGFIFQAFNLINDMTAVENVELPMGFAGLNSRERRTNAMKLLDDVGLKDKAFNKPLELSGGQQQRVAIARALANNPKIILADEPTGNLDEESGFQIMDLLKNLNNQKKVTIIMVTHDEQIAKYADRIVYMRDGVLL